MNIDDKELNDIKSKISDVEIYISKLNQKDRRELILFLFNAYILAFLSVILPQYFLSSDISDKVMAILLFVFVLGVMPIGLILIYWHLYKNIPTLKKYIEGRGPRMEPFDLSSTTEKLKDVQEIDDLKGKINHIIFELTNTSFGKFKKIITFTSLISLFSGFAAFIVIYYIPLIEFKIVVAIGIAFFMLMGLMILDK